MLSLSPATPLPLHPGTPQAAPRRPLCARAWIYASLLVVAGCEAEERVAAVSFALRALPSCELSGATSLELSALGDFPTLRERMSLRARSAAVSDLPSETRELALEGTFGDVQAAARADAAAALSGAQSELLMLPELRSCPLGDPLAAATEGSAVGAMPRGGMLLAGGSEEGGLASSNALVLGPGRTLVEQVPDGMLLRRRHASATLVAGRVVIAGGAADLRGSAADTYEVYDPASGRFERELSRRLSASRMQHGAVALPESAVLLVGGRSEPGGPPLASAERIELTDSPAAPTALALNVARVAPDVFVLDSGSVLISGGLDDEGHGITSLERFEPADEGFELLDVRWTESQSSAACALPGDRIARIGCDAEPAPRCLLELALVRADGTRLLGTALAFAEQAPLGLLDLRLIGLDDGRLLVTGRDPGAVVSRAFVVDLAAQTIEASEASRAPSVLFALADGAIAELDTAGASLRRVGSISRYDSPAGDLVSGEGRLALDAAEHWERSAEGLHARAPDARLDVPRLRFADVRVELAATGELTVMLAAAGAPDLAIHLAPGARPSSGCPPLAENRDLVARIERVAESVEISVGASPKIACRVPWPARSAARVALIARNNALLRSLRVTRL